MKEHFDRPVPGRDAATRLTALRQRSQSVAEYVVEFHTVDIEAGCNDVELHGVFYQDFQEALKDELAMRDETSSLDQCIALTIKLASRLQECKQEKRAQFSGGASRAQTSSWSWSPPSSASQPEAVQLGWTQLIERIKEHRGEAELCLCCRKPGHFITICPRCPPKESAHQ